ncbi:hypothetical protein OE88DRAFT_1653126 [Heliocybe sulcata]|uniref:Cyclin N-terminal domain-containing protein n=1 Tax=Heliocybe sulcata TaxID=5364 RepID=A0A5C3NCF7_9AGAM|nr:hypothetical protein OE88DRAFT_1653126 [Heliocybe sulcata]
MSGPNPKHPSSLIPSSEHNLLIEELLRIPNCHWWLIDYMTRWVCRLANVYTGDHPSRTFPALNLYAYSVIVQASIPTAVILRTIVYLSRATHYRAGCVEMVHRKIFLGAMMSAYKCANDATHKGSSWSRFSQHFSPQQILQIELDWNFSLDFEFELSDDDILQHYEPLKQACFPPPAGSHEIRAVMAQPAVTPIHYERPQRALVSSSPPDFDSEPSPASPSASGSRSPSRSSSSPFNQSLDGSTPESTLVSPLPRPARRRRRPSPVPSYDHGVSERSRSRQEDLSTAPTSRERAQHIQRHCSGSAQCPGSPEDPAILHRVLRVLRSHGHPIPNVLAVWERSQKVSDSLPGQDRHTPVDAPRHRLRSKPYDHPHASRVARRSTRTRAF